MPLIPSPLQASTIPEIKVDGRANAELARDVCLLQIDEDVHGLRRLLATFVAVGPRSGEPNERLNWLDGAVLDFGKELRVALGPTDARREMFAGKLSALELSMEQGRTPEVVCLAEDRLMDLRLTRRFKTYENVSEADLLQQIAAEHGLSAVADVAGPTWPLAQQWNQSDLAFLRERARRLAAEVWVDGDALHMATRDRRGGNAVTLIQGSNLRQVRLRADLAAQRSKVVVGGFDDGDQDAIDEAAESSAIAAEAQGNTHGAQVLERAFGERVSYRVRDVPLADSEAGAMARASLLGRARRFVGVTGVADGSTAIGVGSLLRLERVSPLFEGDGYYVTRVRHQYDQTSGYRTHFDAERAWLGRAT
ncbi:phage late control D family protein [Accumulibacter sp.]|uniref:phage late control D family protein n=1 Tax=Accumulibacter sp. TaxID=2053492 RepID=UPI002602F816|nr:contractile injection system protein, VgrG/Pvc8 family [Accumulibacter sp.]